jgi:MFS family permease
MTRIWLASAFMILSAASGPFINVSFFSLFADITPSNIRGRYLGTRQRIATVMGILGGFMTAWLLDILPGFNGYALVFSLAALFGTIDILMFIWVKFPKMLDSEQKESIKTMLADVFSNGQFLKIVIFVTFWMFSINLSAQFYLVYTRTSLGMSNTAITLIAQILPSICSVIVLSRWGRALDKKGTRHVLMRCAKLSSFAPLLWLFVAPGWFSVILIFITYASAGLLMSGMEIGNQNAFMSRSPEKNRSMYIAVYFCITSLFGIALANTVGGWLLDNPLMVLEGFGFGAFGVDFNRYNYLFFITFLLRVGIAFGLLPRMVKE